MKAPRAGLQDPWATLGISRTACEKEVKTAHRQLVKQLHPDVRGGGDALAHAKFLKVQEAYELIIGKCAGKDIDATPGAQGGWSFHDWYWSFSMKRRRGKGPFGAGAAAGAAEPPPLERQQWKAQMAGLKQKAAGKRRTQPGAAAAAGAAPAAATAAGGPAGSSAGRERVWRSMTKNARNADAAAAKAAAAAQAFGTAEQQQQHAVGTGAPQAPEPMPAPQESPVAAAAAAAQPEQPAPAMHHEVSPPPSSSGSSSVHQERLRRLKEQAAAVVEHVGGQLRGHMTLQQLAALLEGRLQRDRTAPAGAHGSFANAVPADAQLHHRFMASWRRREHQQAAGQAAAAAAAPEHHAVADEAPEHLQHLQQQEHEAHEAHADGAAYSHAYSSHSRKFADRDDVEQRLSGQLAGLKRRAALKQEVQSGW